MYFYWLSMTHLKTGQRNIFMKNGFQIRIQHPQISFGANFQNFLTTLRFSRKLTPTFWRTGPRPKQHVPPVSHLSCWKVQISGNPILSSPLYIKLVLRKYWYPPKQIPRLSSLDQSASARARRSPLIGREGGERGGISNDICPNKLNILPKQNEKVRTCFYHRSLMKMFL